MRNKVYSSKSKMDFIKDLLIEEGFPEESFTTKRRYKELVEGRSWFSWLCKEVFKNEISYPDMAEYLNLSDHTSCLHQVARKQSDVEIYDVDRKKSIDLVTKAGGYYSILNTLQDDLRKKKVEMNEWLLKVERSIDDIYGHINRDSVIEGWRRERINQSLLSFKEEISKIELIAID